jgi:hypothetical protein
VLAFGLALLVAQSPAEKHNAEIMKRDAQLAAAFKKELADWKAGAASKVWGPVLDTPDEVTAGPVVFDPFTPGGPMFRPGTRVRPLTAEERTELQTLLHSGVFHRTMPPPSKCAFNPSFGLWWTKGEARASAVVCFDCCQVMAEGNDVRSVDCEKLRAWSVSLMKN